MNCRSRDSPDCNDPVLVRAILRPYGRGVEIVNAVCESGHDNVRAAIALNQR